MKSSDMPPLSSDTEKISYYQVHLARIADFKPEIKEQYTEELAICFLTIRDLRNLTFDVHTNLATGISSDFIEEIILVDFNYVISNLRDYKGKDETGVNEALDFMKKAIEQLYLIYSSLLNENESRTKNITTRVAAFLEYHTHLHDAYEQLEHLTVHISEPTSDKSTTE